MAAIPEIQVKITVDVEQATAALAILRLEMWRAEDPKAERYFEVTRSADDWQVALFGPGLPKRFQADRGTTLAEAVDLLFPRAVLRDVHVRDDSVCKHGPSQYPDDQRCADGQRVIEAWS